MEKADVHLQYINDVHCKVVAEASILLELSERFTFLKENYKFDPKYKARVWDGKIRMIHTLTGLVYGGLAQSIKKHCDSVGYTFSFSDELAYDNVSVNEVEEHIKSLNLPEKLQVRDYQLDAVVKCLRSKRRTLLSPTSSGKSLMIYLLFSWYKRKTLIIVPTTGLVEQFKSDLENYGFKGVIETSIGGLSKDKNINCDVCITTWQALDNGKTKMDEKWYDQFKVVVGDEAHGYKATSLIKILTSMKHTPYRFGTTGTLDNNELNKHTIYGLFGAPYLTTTTRELIDSGHAADIQIKCIVLRYPEDVRKQYNKAVKDPVTQKAKKKTYPEEVDFIISYTKRTQFIKNLCLSLKGNKLVFFRRVDHGASIRDAFGENDRVFYIDGDIKDREEIRKAIEEEENAILVASLGTTSTGVSINRLHHMIAASPSKSKIKVLQSIGRMLRQHEEKDKAILYDIVDDLSWNGKKNFTLEHFEERAKIYDSEQFDYTLYTVSIK